MGHTNIIMTLDYYAHATFNSAEAEIERLTMLHIRTEKVCIRTVDCQVILYYKKICKETII